MKLFNLFMDSISISLVGMGFLLFFVNNVADSIFFIVVAILINTRGLRANK